MRQLLMEFHKTTSYDPRNKTGTSLDAINCISISTRD